MNFGLSFESRLGKHREATRDTRATQSRRGRDQLATIGLFARCTRQELTHISRLGTQLALDAERVVLHEGGNAEAFFVIVAGEATVSLEGKPIGRLHAGSFFGEHGLLDLGPDGTTVTAATPMIVLVFGRREFADLIAGAPPVARVIMRALATEARGAKAALGRLQHDPTLQTRPPIHTPEKSLTHAMANDTRSGSTPTPTPTPGASS